MGIALMVSIWPTVDQLSENYQPMWGPWASWYTVSAASKPTMEFLGSCTFFDATNPESREYVWQKAKANYFDKGVRLFGWMRPNQNTQYMTLTTTAISGQQPAGRQSLSRHVRQGFLLMALRAEGQERIGQSAALRLGWQPTLRCVGMER